MDNSKRDLIVAIDFGTKYSGFCLAEVNAVGESGIHVFRDWGSFQGVSLYKTPTCLLLTSEGKFHRFGHAAVETYTKHKTSDPADELLYFDRFKLVLHNTKVSDEAKIKYPIIIAPSQIMCY